MHLIWFDGMMRHGMTFAAPAGPAYAACSATPVTFSFSDAASKSPAFDGTAACDAGCVSTI